MPQFSAEEMAVLPGHPGPLGNSYAVAILPWSVGALVGSVVGTLVGTFVGNIVGNIAVGYSVGLGEG